MNEEKLKKLCDAWIEAEAAPDPEDDDFDAVAELKPAGFRLEYAGRYWLQRKPNQFTPGMFCEYSGWDQDGRSRSMLWRRFTSTDENY